MASDTVAYVPFLLIVPAISNGWREMDPESRKPFCTIVKSCEGGRSSEHHWLGLFSHQDYQDAFHLAGLEVSCDTGNLFGDGLVTDIESS